MPKLTKKQGILLALFCHQEEKQLTKVVVTLYFCRQGTGAGNYVRQRAGKTWRNHGFMVLPILS